MKNRRIILISFLLVTTLCVGIGYAAIQDTLTINGTASADAQQAIDGDVFFDKENATVVSSGSGVAEAESGQEAQSLDSVEISEDGNTATLTANSLRSQGETVVFSLMIKNDSPDLSVKVTPKTANNSNEEYFTVKYDWESSTPSDFAETTIANNGSKTLTVTITLAKTPTADAGESATFSVEIDAVYDTSAG